MPDLLPALIDLPPRRVGLVWRREGTAMVAGPYRVTWQPQAPRYAATWHGRTLVRDGDRSVVLSACEAHWTAGIGVTC